MQAKHLKFLIIGLLMVLGNQVLMSQQNQTDELGRKQGKWLKYKDGVKFYEGQFIDDKPMGEFLRYYRSGRLLSKTQYSKNGKNCFAEIYYDNRKRTPKAIGLYVDQIKDSTWLIYNEEGFLISEETYDHGLEDGLWKLYNYLGVLVKETPYSQGKIHGIQKEYFEDGEVLRLMTFEEDELNGTFEVYYSDGSIRTQGAFDMGSKIGEWQYYELDGKIMYTEYYEEGVLLKRLDINGNHYEIHQEVDTINLHKTPEEIMEMR